MRSKCGLFLVAYELEKELGTSPSVRYMHPVQAAGAKPAGSVSVNAAAPKPSSHEHAAACFFEDQGLGSCPCCPLLQLSRHRLQSLPSTVHVVVPSPLLHRSDSPGRMPRVLHQSMRLPPQPARHPTASRCCRELQRCSRSRLGR